MSKLKELLETSYDYNGRTLGIKYNHDMVKRTILGDFTELIFNSVEPCEPDCDDVRHAYHQGQWDMHIRLSEMAKRYCE